MVQRFEDVEQSQSEVMTALARQAFLEEGADLVLPLDADEFLVSDDGVSCRAVLEQFAVDRVYSLDWVRYLLAEPDAGQDVFLLSRPAWRSRAATSMETSGERAKSSCGAGSLTASKTSRPGRWARRCANRRRVGMS